MLKKYTMAALLFMLVPALCGCGHKQRAADLGKIENGKDSLPVQAKQLIPEELITVGFVQVGHESDWRIAATKTFHEMFSEQNGYQMYFVDADNEPAKQVQAVRSFIQDAVDYIVIDPILPTGWTAVLKEAEHAGIPVFIVDREIDCQPRYYRSWIGSDFVREGQCAGQWLQNYIAGRGRAREQIRIVTINGTKGASAQLGRTAGFASYVERNKNWTLLDEKSGDFTEAGGRRVMEQYLEQYPDIDVVVCQNDNEALGACAVLEEAGIAYGRKGGVIVISFDATRAGLLAVEDGRIHADFECNPMSAAALDKAIRTLEAGGVLKNKKIYLEEDCFTGDANAMTLHVGGMDIQMIPVTKELIQRRDY